MRMGVGVGVGVHTSSTDRIRRVDLGGGDTIGLGHLVAGGGVGGGPGVQWSTTATATTTTATSTGGRCQVDEHVGGGVCMGMVGDRDRRSSSIPSIRLSEQGGDDFVGDPFRWLWIDLVVQHSLDAVELLGFWLCLERAPSNHHGTTGRRGLPEYGTSSRGMWMSSRSSGDIHIGGFDGGRRGRRRRCGHDDHQGRMLVVDRW